MKKNQVHRTPPEVAKSIQVPEYKEVLSKIWRRYDKIGRGMPLLDMELARIQMIADVIEAKTSFVSELNSLIRNLDPFYRDLLYLEFEEEEVRKALNCIYRARKLARDFAKKYRYILMAQEKNSKIKAKAAEARGRMLSPLKRCNKSLLYLKNLVIYISKLPGIDPGAPAIIVGGAPSVGKSSLVSSASRADIEVAEYPFTTKEIHVGHTFVDGVKIQLIDTPGLLDRKLEDRNEIELKAVTALKQLAGLIVFLIDPTETAALPLGNQIELALEIQSFIGSKPFIYTISKMDAVKPKKLVEAKEKIKSLTGAKEVYTVKTNDPHSVKVFIEEIARKYIIGSKTS